jgi:hypothetical protein
VQLTGEVFEDRPERGEGESRLVNSTLGDGERVEVLQPGVDLLELVIVENIGPLRLVCPVLALPDEWAVENLREALG